MIKISKSHIGLPPYDTEIVKADIKDIGINISDDYLLAFDTAKEIVYCSEQEIKQVMKNLPADMLEIFKLVYAENEDIHDCIDHGIRDRLVTATMNTLTMDCQKHFYDFGEFVEDELVTFYHSTKVPA